MEINKRVIELLEWTDPDRDPDVRIRIDDADLVELVRRRIAERQQRPRRSRWRDQVETKRSSPW
jgi:hypothetical protein